MKFLLGSLAIFALLSAPQTHATTFYDIDLGGICSMVSMTKLEGGGVNIVVTEQIKFKFPETEVVPVEGSMDSQAYRFGAGVITIEKNVWMLDEYKTAVSKPVKIQLEVTRPNPLQKHLKISIEQFNPFTREKQSSVVENLLDRFDELVPTSFNVRQSILFSDFEEEAPTDALVRSGVVCEFRDRAAQ